MKVKCINNLGCEKFLTIGKIYEVNKDGLCNYGIINDNNHKDWYPKEWFKPLAEYRIEQINKLLRE